MSAMPLATRPRTGSATVSTHGEPVPPRTMSDTSTAAPLARPAAPMVAVSVAVVSERAMPTVSAAADGPRAAGAAPADAP